MFTITVILSLAAGISAQDWLPTTSAASDAQIRFAVENKYDSTGPGAQTPEYAYKTYKTLDEALVAYANDPDTQLPELEKSKALFKLSRQSYNSISNEAPAPRYQPKIVDKYTGYKPSPIKNNPIHEYVDHKPSIVSPYDVLSDYTGWKILGHPKIINDNSFYKPRKIISEATYPRHHSSYGFETLHQHHPGVNGRPQAERFREQPSELREFDPHPQYSFSYGVHDKGTGDSKSAHETRDGGKVQGYYTFMDADGKQRTVHYTADDKFGFRASVQRTHTNTQ